MDLRDAGRTGLNLAAGMALALGLAVGLAGLLSGCASSSGPEDAFKALTRVDYGKPYIGLSKAEVLSCAGQPRSRIPAGESSETLVYHYNGAGPESAAAECSASLTFEKNVLV